MQDKERLTQKLAEKRQQKADLQTNGYTAQLEADVAEFRAQREMKLRADYEADLGRLDNYIKVIKDMFAEIEAEEQAAAEAAAQAATDPNAPPTVA